ncbi:MAG: NAD(P)/FAD-dependent oxidoreductase [Thermoleophilaceae bacterium]
MRIAIVGAGIAGLVCAHRLHPEHDITVYEANDHAGGHTNTVRADLGDETHWVDTGFIVYNDRNYPNFEPLLAELHVQTQESKMSFSVSDDSGSFEYAGTPRGLFAQSSNLTDRRFLRMIADLVRFNREATKLLELRPGEGPSLREFLREGGYGEWLCDRLIVPQASAVWSADPEQMWSFPAAFLARFFHNHGMLGFSGRPQWRTVTGGSHRYVEAITRPFSDRIRTSTPVRSIQRTPDGVDVSADGCETERYDEVVVAAHSDQALGMLARPTQAERDVLGAIAFQPNEAVLHTDSSLLPRWRAARASWNFHLTDPVEPHTTLTYWMNSLQSLRSRHDLCVTLNRTERIDPAKVIETIRYSHPVFTPEGVAAQSRQMEISGADRIHYCGAYWRWGFHEDGVVSALRALDRVGRSRAAAPEHTSAEPSQVAA